jgi:transcriptional regulator with XRE-family HTH domain
MNNQAGGPPELHARIRSLRRRQKRTLKEVAAQCGFTESLLSKIEAGKTTPPLATLSRIATALGVGLTDLLDGSTRSTIAMTSAAALGDRPLTPTAKGYGFHVLAPDRAGKLMQPFLFVARRGEVMPGALSHAGEEFVYILEGRLRYRVAGVTHELGPGDSLYFDAEDEHDFEPLTPEVRYIGIFTERRTPTTDRNH